MPRPLIRSAALIVCAALLAPSFAMASAYNARPKLVVIVIVDQLGAAMLERHREAFGPNGFRFLLDRGAYFSDCRYDYLNLRTAASHATIVTGAYTDGHGIPGNEFWDPQEKRTAAARDPEAKTLGAAADRGFSPRNLLASTIGDELKLATGGRARVYSMSLKDGASVLSAGHAANAAYWADRRTGLVSTSTFYLQKLPEWVERFNSEKRTDKYENQEWKNAAGKVMGRSTSSERQADEPFYYGIGQTPFGTDYELEFARELVSNEKLGSGPATDLLILSLSSNDILGHEVGPESEKAAAMLARIDAQLADFFGFLGRQLGLANVWLVLTSDHGAPPTPNTTNKMRFPLLGRGLGETRRRANNTLSARLKRQADYVLFSEAGYAYLNQEAFEAAGVSQADAERMVGETMRNIGAWQRWMGRTQLESGAVPPTAAGRRFAHSYTSHAGWYVIGELAPYFMGAAPETDHLTGLSYDAQVPVLFFGLPFRAGTYRGACEVIDIVPTLSNLLGITRPSHSTGRVLTEMLGREGAEEKAP